MELMVSFSRMSVRSVTAGSTPDIRSKSPARVPWAWLPVFGNGLGTEALHKPYIRAPGAQQQARSGHASEHRWTVAAPMLTFHGGDGQIYNQRAVGDREQVSRPYPRRRHLLLFHSGSVLAALAVSAPRAVRAANGLLIRPGKHLPVLAQETDKVDRRC
jgi:hypothetical protein